MIASVANWATRTPPAPKPEPKKPLEKTRAYKRRFRQKPRFSLKGNVATLSLSRVQYKITPQGWVRTTHKTSKKRIALQDKRAA